MSTTSAQGIIAASTVLPVLGIVVVSLRFYVRAKQKARLKFDDWAQIPALVIFVAMGIVALVGVANGALGYPSPPSDPPDSSPSTILCEKLWFVLQLIQIPALALIKIAALRFYRRIFCVDRKGALYVAIWILIGLTVTWGIGFLVFYVTSCGSHPDAAWSGLIGFLQYCRTSETFEESYAISDMLLDTLVLLTPLPSIWNLQTSAKRKLGISGVFMLAFIGYAASIARLAIFVELTESTLASAPPDVQTQDTQATWFSMLELGLAIIALNMPSIWGLITSVSMESAVRSLRGVFSLQSRGSRASGTESSGNWARMGRSEGGSSHDKSQQGIDLVPQYKNSGVDSSITGNEPLDDAHDLESGINVRREIDRTEHHV